MLEQNNNKNASQPNMAQPDLGKPVDIDQPGTDSVSEDINAFKKFFKMLTGGFHSKAKPVAQKVQQKVVEKTPQRVIEKIPRKQGSGWVKLLFIPVFILVAVLIFTTVSRNTTEKNKEKEEEEGATPTDTITPTPTLEPFKPVEASIYADDPEVIELQERLDVINNEMFSVPLRDNTLNPPVLDFNIVFK